MSLYFQQENRENNIKKYRKSHSKDIVKRAWKTPSPGMHSDLKSPRFTRNKEKQQLKFQQNNETDPQNQYQSHISNNKYTQMKQQNIQEKTKKDESKNRMNKRVTKLNKNTVEQEEGQTYSYYFHRNLKSKRSSKGLQMPYTTRNLESAKSFQQDFNANRHLNAINTSMTHENNQSLSSLKNRNPNYHSAHSLTQQSGIQSHKKVHQTIRKYANQNEKLKRQVINLSQKYKASQKSKIDLQRKCNEYKKSLTQSKKSSKILFPSNKSNSNNNADNICKAHQQLNDIKQEQVQRLKTLLQKNEEQLNSSNLQIYQMRQQIFQLKIINQRLTNTLAIKQIPTHQKGSSNGYQIELRSKKIMKKSDFVIYSQGIKQQCLTTTDANTFSQKDAYSSYEEKQKMRIEKAITTQYYRNGSRSTESKPTSLPNGSCRECQVFQKKIRQYSELTEFQLLQISKKQNIIKSLCDEIRSLQNELRILDKPRSMYKKLNAFISQLNDQIVQNHIKQLNLKYQNQGGSFIK